MLTVDEPLHHQSGIVGKGRKQGLQQTAAQRFVGLAQPAEGGRRGTGLLIETGAILLQGTQGLLPAHSIQPGQPVAVEHRHGAAIRKYHFLRTWGERNGPHLADGLVAAPDDAQPAAGRQPACSAFVVTIANEAGAHGDPLPLNPAEEVVQYGQHGILHRIAAR